MTTITPAADAGERAIVAMNKRMDELLAQGSHPGDVRVTRSLLEANMRTLCVELDLEIEFPALMASFEAGFANCIASFVRTVANRQGFDTERLGAAFLDGLVDRTVGVLTNPETQRVSERVKPVPGHRA